ncbi:hypothetical protein [Phytohabitans suffuscus]|uniref:Uncharacterized protein n=1 Tax=Phytohabitans suffuscus TaxID=624315 RepID=A0A6F8YRK8_9ACTN|nr:hypothetical protein [Phytohabitans suffuscus]BCB88471.1 hypothetical protein Psuf_057840 [Phytohabitans suffuscus]
MPETRTQTRQATVDRLHRIADDHAGGYRPGLTRADALAELAATSSDPDLLARAAAAHAMADNWYAIVAVDLLIEAGADEDLIQEHIAELG